MITTSKRSANQGRRELRAAVRFFKGDTPAGKRWLRAKRRNRLKTLTQNNA